MDIPYDADEDPTLNYDDGQICDDCPGTGSLMCCFHEHAVAEEEQRREDERNMAIIRASRDMPDGVKGRESVREYELVDNKGDKYTYQASDMRMALVVHHQMVGTDPVKCERPETEGEWYNRMNGLA